MKPSCESFKVKCERIWDSDGRPKEAIEDGLFYFYVRLYVEEKEESVLSLNDIDLVIYKLHHTFGKHQFQRSTNRAKNFEIRIWTFGWFPVRATIVTKDNRTFDIAGKVEFEVTDKHRQANGRDEFEW